MEVVHVLMDQHHPPEGEDPPSQVPKWVGKPDLAPLHCQTDPCFDTFQYLSAVVKKVTALLVKPPKHASARGDLNSI